MINFYQILTTSRITFEEAKSRRLRFNNLLHMLVNTTARKKSYKEKSLRS